MAKRKIRFTVLDLVLILIVLAVVAYAILRNTQISSFNRENTENNVVVTLELRGVTRNSFEYFSKGDTINVLEGNNSYTLGEINSIRSSPSVVVEEGEKGFSYVPDFNTLDLFIETSAACTTDRNGFCIIDGMYISPSAELSCDNGRIIFDCVVSSVKIVD